jgi:hypothetical protein
VDIHDLKSIHDTIIFKMDQIKTQLTELRTQLNNIFTGEWGTLQHEAFQVLQQTVTQFKQDNRIFESKDDRAIIRNNIKDQLWFTHSKAKPIIGHLFDTMKLVHYTYEHDEHILNFYLILSFDQFQVHACMYQNYLNNMVNYYIYFENSKHQKAFMTYYNTDKSGVDFTKSRVPEFERIYLITNLSQNILIQYDLLNFFTEVIMYYDESFTMEKTPISLQLNVSLNQLIEKYNKYILQKKTETDYKVIES